ncbi:MAG: sigma 54-interacting transcriptional regulator [Polyangiaceae bacterium]|nr:sigma 54-interacting transcriptional regulator [Polyangiaceae bacterium]
MALSLVTQIAVGERSGFLELDALVRAEGSSGVVRVEGLARAASHLARRARAAGRACFVVDSPKAGLDAELAARLGVSHAEVGVLARALDERAPCVLVLSPSASDLELLAELPSLARSLVLVEHEGAELVVEAALPTEAARACLDALADEDASPISLRGVAALEAWWGRGVPVRALPAPPEVTAPDRALWALLSDGARAWPMSGLASLGVASAVERLKTAGAVRIEGAAVRVVWPAPEPSDPAALAGALAAVFPADPRALASASELWAERGEVARAEITLVDALSRCDAAADRALVWAAFERVGGALPAGAIVGFSERAAELALAVGDPDAASTWAHRLLEARAPGGAAHLALGRALLAAGDLRAARVALEEARDRASTPRDRARAVAQLAEVSYLSGAHAAARELAEEAGHAGDAALTARNTLGKLLLASGEFAAAEAHFIADGFEARRLGDRSAELRARVNRAIAVLSDGRADEARGLLELVLDEARAGRDHRAAAFALSNLAVLATNRRDYELALSLSEAALTARRKLGERVGLARLVANLAELRLRLGLVREAEQVLSFGRAVPSREGPAPALAHLALVSARVHLERGDVARARVEVEAALAGAVGSSDGDMLGEAHRVGARVELEDGDARAAARHLEAATRVAGAPYARAEIALLAVDVARARGELDVEQAEAAVAACRAAAHGELVEEAHALAAAVYLAAGDAPLAAHHASRAAALLDELRRSLSPRLERAFSGRRTVQRLDAEIARARAAAPVEASPAPAGRAPAPPRLLGSHPRMRALVDAVKKVARTDATVLIHGESGTGKELVAEALHAASARRGAPLVKVNCSALVESLLLSELFGHEKGAFTGAVSRRRGRFELAEGGTLFLDEIGDIPPATQVALLRVLQERTFERVGGASPLTANVRVVCATHRDLRAMVERGAFREDLYFRLAGLVLRVPSLRERDGDLPVLAASILARVAAERGEPPKRLDASALALLERHAWPGNGRELDNALRAAALFADGAELSAADLQEHVDALRAVADEPARAASCAADDDAPGGDASTGNSEAVSLVYDDMKAGRFGLFDAKRHLERECIVRALDETRGNITRAAALLGMKRPRLSQLVKQYGLGHAPEGLT